MTAAAGSGTGERRGRPRLLSPRSFVLVPVLMLVIGAAVWLAAQEEEGDGASFSPPTTSSPATTDRDEPLPAQPGLERGEAPSAELTPNGPPAAGVAGRPATPTSTRVYEPRKGEIVVPNKPECTGPDVFDQPGCESVTAP